MFLHHSTSAMVDKNVFWDVVLDFAAYPNFVAMVRSVDVNFEEVQAQGTREGVWEVRFVISMIRSLQYTLKLEKISENELRWNLIQGDFQQNSGRWLVTSQKETLHIEYEIQMNLKTFMPATIRHSLEKVWLPNMVESFIQETKKRQGISN